MFTGDLKIPFIYICVISSGEKKPTIHLYIFLWGKMSLNIVYPEVVGWLCPNDCDFITSVRTIDGPGFRLDIFRLPCNPATYVQVQTKNWISADLVNALISLLSTAFMRLNLMNIQWFISINSHPHKYSWDSFSSIFMIFILINIHENINIHESNGWSILLHLPLVWLTAVQLAKRQLKHPSNFTYTDQCFVDKFINKLNHKQQPMSEFTRSVLVLGCKQV